MLPAITPRLIFAIDKSFRFGFVRDYSRIPVTTGDHEWFSNYPQPFMPVCSRLRKERHERFCAFLLMTRQQRARIVRDRKAPSRVRERDHEAVLAAGTQSTGRIRTMFAALTTLPSPWQNP